MLDENRIRLMTRMASFEANEGKKYIPIATYFRGDYISYNVIKAAISATVAYVLVVAVYIYYNLENYMADLYKLDIMDIAHKMYKGYIVVVGVYCLVAFIIYALRYNRAKKNIQEYYQALKKLGNLYDEEE